MKAKGGGISIPLDNISVLKTPGGEVEILDRNETIEEGIPWKVADLEFEEVDSGARYVGAVVGEGRDWRVSVREWHGNMFCSPNAFLVQGEGFEPCCGPRGGDRNS